MKNKPKIRITLSLKRLIQKNKLQSISLQKITNFRMILARIRLEFHKFQREESQICQSAFHQKLMIVPISRPKSNRKVLSQTNIIMSTQLQVTKILSVKRENIGLLLQFVDFRVTEQIIRILNFWKAKNNCINRSKVRKQ